MFTGLVEAVCQVTLARPAHAGGGRCLDVDLGDLHAGSRPGDSVAINGVCLTIESQQGRVARFAVSPETLAKSTLDALSAGDAVNAERALRVGDRLGGHFVQGHVDGCARIEALRRQGDFWDVRFAADPALLTGLVPQGSVAVDGVSLTVADLAPHGFSVAVIPETMARTTLSGRDIGDRVNIELDLLIKAVRRTCESLLGRGDRPTTARGLSFGF